MCGEFGEVTVIIGLVINFLAFGTPFVSFRDTLSYIFPAPEGSPFLTVNLTVKLARLGQRPFGIFSENSSLFLMATRP